MSNSIFVIISLVIPTSILAVMFVDAFKSFQHLKSIKSSAVKIYFPPKVRLSYTPLFVIAFTFVLIGFSLFVILKGNTEKEWVLIVLYFLLTLLFIILYKVSGWGKGYYLLNNNILILHNRKFAENINIKDVKKIDILSESECSNILMKALYHSPNNNYVLIRKNIGSPPTIAKYISVPLVHVSHKKRRTGTGPLIRSVKIGSDSVKIELISGKEFIITPKDIGHFVSCINNITHE